MVNPPHIPVMLEEVIANLQPQSKMVYVDATFGAGGYSKAIMLAADCNVIALDRDPYVLTTAQECQEKFGDRFQFHHQSFADMEKIINKQNIEIDGIVFDVGVSSMQIDTPERGFSFQEDGNLDMRMNPAQELDASYIINHYPQEELANIFYNYGGEKRSRAIAQAIVQARNASPITRTTELAELIRKAVPNYSDSINPATRTFQALRIVINDELEQLRKGLLAATNLVSINGKVVVVSFHSLEDKIVKDTFKELCGKKIAVNKYASTTTAEESGHKFTFAHKGVITPSRQEIKQNPRARSAKLRVVRRVK